MIAQALGNREWRAPVSITSTIARDGFFFIVLLNNEQIKTWHPCARTLYALLLRLVL